MLKVFLVHFPARMDDRQNHLEKNEKRRYPKSPAENALHLELRPEWTWKAPQRRDQPR